MQEKGAPDGHRPQLRGALRVMDGMAVITIADNGIGLPADRGQAVRALCHDPRKGHRAGLCRFVKKIIEEHGGTLELRDAEPFEDGAHRGAEACITLPILPYEETA